MLDNNPQLICPCVIHILTALRERYMLLMHTEVCVRVFGEFDLKRRRGAPFGRDHFT